ncbi:gas vesicle protein GvpN [Bacillus sp. FJAT-27225]|uniref:gas vesicle protein GvpN n=1 Tax=Bacillus sp. FJAT-27225 TaxID=1743144 RepID=UPI00080C332E|nr:gas vesicle protein GvpN [Bacillus sp. FJAT-27225]OCA82272.1 gas vesicle protein GvpN [Bacillus sp. FJAT-27225]
MTVLKNKTKKQKQSIVWDHVTEDLLARSSRYLKAGYPVHFTGPSGTGKTSLALELAKTRKRPVMLIHGHHELNTKDLIGDFTGYTSKKVVDNYIRSVYKRDESITETWRDGRLLEAVKNGYTLIYDEFTRSKPTTNNIFLSILEEGILPLYGTKLTEPFIRVHPDFTVIFTSNPAEYAGVYVTQDALLDRLVTIHIDHKDSEREAHILSGKVDISKSEAAAITNLVAELRKQCKEESGPSLRASLMIATIAKNEGIQIDGKDLEFQKLCIDILGQQISRSIDADNPIKTAKGMIKKACSNLELKKE